jgi:hypothetical protein
VEICGLGVTLTLPVPLLLQLYLRQFTCVGLWRSEVLSVRVNTVPYAYRDPTGSMSDTVTVTVGDPWQGGAATELTFPYQTGWVAHTWSEPKACAHTVLFGYHGVRHRQGG